MLFKNMFFILYNLKKHQNTIILVNTDVTFVMDSNYHKKQYFKILNLKKKSVPS